MMNRREVLELFGRQYGVAATSQLVDLGVSARTVGRARRDGLLVPMTAHVARAVDQPETFESRAMAAQLQLGDEAMLTATTAGALLGLRSMPRTRIEVALAARSRRSCPPWIATRVDHERDPQDGVRRADGLFVARPFRTLLDLAVSFNDHRFQRAAEDAWLLKLITPESCAAYLDLRRRRGRPGVARFDRWVTAALPRQRPTQSNFERDMLDVIRACGLPDPARQYALVLGTGDVVHLDIAWPDLLLAIEPGHTFWHGGVARTRADMARDRACSELGWLVVRYDESAYDDMTAVGREIVRVYEARRRSVRSPARRT